MRSMFHCHADAIESNVSNPSSASAIMNWMAKNGLPPVFSCTNCARGLASSGPQCRASAMSRLTRSPKNGNFSNVRRRLSAVSLRNRPNSKSGDTSKFHKSLPFAGLSSIAEGKVSRRAGLAGWRRSADRTSLQANSLLTGNFTGKFAISGLRDALLRPKVAVLQRLLGQFPTGVNRENILKNREGFGGYQGIQLLQPRRHQNKLTSAVPLIVLKKSFRGDERNFLEPLMRFT